MFKKLHSCPKNVELGLFLIRLGLALVFIIHGWAKLTNMDATVGFFASLGLAAFFAYVVALIEFLGGIALLVGYYTQVAGWLLAVVMFFAIILVKGKAGFVGGYEFDLLLLLSSLGMAFIGSGKYSLCQWKKK